MNLFDYLQYGMQIMGYKGFRSLNFPKVLPSNAVYSVTNLCNSKCKTCYIWQKYRRHPELAKNEMTTEEWLKTWRSMGKVTYVTWTGGEPFLRRDALELLKGVYEHNQPRIMNICHNGSMPRRFERILADFLPRVSDTSLTINLSLDGIGKDHDMIRGMQGNWERLVETIRIIKGLQEQYSNLNLGLHTVVSKWNVAKVPEIYDYVVENLSPDSYIMEPAELRYELGTINSDILPHKENLSKVFRVYSSDRNHTMLVKLVRDIYIDKYIKGNGLPCYATFNHTQITTNGNVWICCMQADHEPLGNLHDVDFDFRKIWFSERADEIREKVKKRAYSTCQGCYLAVAANTSIPQNIFLTARYLLK